MAQEAGACSDDKARATERLPETPDDCLLNAVKLMKEAEMGGPKRGGAMLGGGLTRKSSKEPIDPPGPGARRPGQTPHLDAVQQLAHAPEAVGFNAAQHVLRQIGHVEVLHILFCKTKGGESPEVFSKKWREKDRV